MDASKESVGYDANLCKFKYDSQKHYIDHNAFKIECSAEALN